MAWETYMHANGKPSKYLTYTDYPEHVVLVRIEPLPMSGSGEKSDGYFWQVDKLFGYESSIEEAKARALEELRFQRVGGV